MGHGAPGCRLPPTDDSLKALGYRTVFVTAFFCIAVTLTRPLRKVKCFHTKELKFLFTTKTHPFPPQKMGKLPVDKRSGLWLNDICTYVKDNDGNSFPLEAPESRRSV
jgi:hypothetical protein